MALLPCNGIVGRRIKVYKGDVATGILFAAQTKSVTLNSESIEVTSDTDEGFRTLLCDPAVRSIDMSIDGILRQDDFLGNLLDPAPQTFLDEYTLFIPGIGEITGDFFLGTFNLAAPHNEGTTFSTSLSSSGAWVFTPEVV